MGQAAKPQMFDISSDLDGESEVLTLGRSLFHDISMFFPSGRNMKATQRQNMIYGLCPVNRLVAGEECVAWSW